MGQDRDMTIVWIVNEHGVKSSKYKWLAEQLLNSNPKWSYCDPEPVGNRKSYPLTGGFYTEEGLKRRQAANEKMGVDDEGERMITDDMLYKDVVQVCKKKGIKTFGKKRADLITELKAL